MVMKPNTSMPPSGQEPLKKMPKIEPAELATNASANPKYQVGKAPAKNADPTVGKGLANKDHDAKFKMPDKVSQQAIKDESFRYGGGRSAGNRSIADNAQRKVQEP